MRYPQAVFPPVLDSTIIAAWKACRHKAFMQYFLHYKPAGTNVHLHAGGAYARGLEVARKAFYDAGLPHEDAVARGVAALIEAYGDFQCPEESGKSLLRTAGALEYYFSNYPMTIDLVRPHRMPTGKHAIEWSAAEPIGALNPDTEEPILYVGRSDMLCDFEGGVFVEDDKTTSSLGARWHEQWHLRSQFTGYTWLAATAAKLDIAGVLVRGTSILKQKYDCAQVISYRPQWMIDEWLLTTRRLVDEMINAYLIYNDVFENHFYKNLDESCTSYGKCPLYDVCRSSDPSPWLRQYFERRIWDPVTRTETFIPPPIRSRVTVSYEIECTEEEFATTDDQDLTRYATTSIVTRVDPVDAPSLEGVRDADLLDNAGLATVASSDPIAALSVPPVRNDMGSSGTPAV